MAVTLVLMMGLTWLFGYIMMFSTVEIYFTIFSTLFNVFNATQVMPDTISLHWYSVAPITIHMVATNDIGYYHPGSFL